MSKNKFKASSFFMKIFLVLAFIVLIFISISIAKETYKKNQVQKEIKSLQEEAQKISRDNTQIKEKIAYLESSEYKTKEAKDKLGLKNLEEDVIIVKPNIEKETATEYPEDKTSTVVPEPKKESNYIKWWNYFFGY